MQKIKIFCSKSKGCGILIIEKVLYRTDKMTNSDIGDRELQLKIDEYGDMLFKLSYIRLQNKQDAEDVVQEVFYQYLKSSQVFENPEHEKAWLLKVTLNACRKVWRSAWKRHQDIFPKDDSDSQDDGRGSRDWEDRTDGTGLNESMPDPEEDALRREEKRLLLEAVLALPAKYRDVIHLFYYEECSVKEIARITGRGESTVTSQLTRGRELLKKSLKEEYDFG